MEALIEGSSGASFHGRLMEAYTLFILWWLFLLGGERTCGVL
jgi:hypothetical protein